MNREEIKNILPHREPMLLVDEVYLNKDGSATGYYNVRGNEFFLKGHFPGKPIVPAVIQCEIMAQASCIMFAEEMKEGMLPVYTGLNKVKFRGQIKPGDRIKIDTSLVKAKHPLYFLKGQLSVDGKVCMSGEFSCAIIDGENKE